MKVDSMKLYQQKSNSNKSKRVKHKKNILQKKQTRRPCGWWGGIKLHNQNNKNRKFITFSLSFQNGWSFFFYFEKE